MAKSKRAIDQERRAAGLNPNPSIMMTESQNPEQSSDEVMERVAQGKAFIVGGTGISDKEGEMLFEEAMEKLIENGKTDPPKMHVISFDGIQIIVME